MNSIVNMHDVLNKCLKDNSSCNFYNCTIDELQALYELLSSKFEIIKNKKNIQKYPRLSPQICANPEAELDWFKSITYADSIESLKRNLLNILASRGN